MSLMLGSAQAQLTLDVSQFTGAAGQAMSSMSKLESAGGNVFNKAGKGVDAFSGRIKNLSSEINTVGIAFVGLGVTITAAIGGAIKTSIDFNSAMANVNSIAQLTTKEIAAISDEVLKMASTTGQGPQTLAEGLYDIYSSGFQGAEGLKILEVSAKAANAGLTTTAVSAKAVTAVLNAYGLEAEDAGHISDVLFQTVNDGVLSFEQLATNLGNTLPLGNALGVSIEELAAAYAQMTLNGISATQAETQISALMRAAINPTEGLTAAIQAYGYESASALIAAEGLPGFLTFLGEASGGSSEKLFDLLGTSEAVNASLVLGKNDVADYTDELMRMTGASEGVGATQKALAKQMESTGFQLKRLKANFQVMLITIGTFFEPAIRTAANAIEKLIQTFLGLPSGVQKAIAILTAITGVVALVGGAMLLALPQILQFRTAMTALGGLKGIVSLIGGGLGFGALIPIILGATAVIGGLTLAYAGNYFGFRDFVDKILGYGKPVLDFFGDLKDGWDDLKGVFGGGEAVDDKTSPLEAMIGGLGGKTAKSGGIAATTTQVSKFSRAIGAVDFALGKLAKNDKAPKIMRDFASSVQSVLPQVLNFSNYLGAIWSGSPRQAMQFIDQMPASFQNIAKAIAPAILGVGELFRSFQIGGLQGFAEQLPKTLTSIGQSISDLFHIVSGGLSLKDWTLDVGIPKVVGIASDLFNAVRDWVLNDAWPAVKSGAITIWDALVNVGSWAKGIVSDIWPYVKKFAEDSWAVAKTTAVTLWDVLTNVGSWAKGIVSDIWPYVQQFASDAWATAKSTAVTIWGVLTNLGSWAKGIVSDIWPYISAFAADAWAAAKNGAVTIWGVLANLGSWAKGIVSDIWPYIKQFASDAWEAVKTAAFTVWDVVVNIGGWVAGKIADLGGWIKSTFGSGGGSTQFDETGGTGMSGTSIDLTGVLVNIGSWAKGIWADVSTFVSDAINLLGSINVDTTDGIFTLNLDGSDFTITVDWGSVWAKLNPTFTDADLAQFNLKGEEIGENIYNGIVAAFSSSGGPNGDGGGNAGLADMGEAFAKGMVEGFGKALVEGMQAKIDELKLDFSSVPILGDALAGIDFVLDVKSDLDDFDWPDLPTWTWPDIPAPGWLSWLTGGESEDHTDPSGETTTVPGSGGGGSKLDKGGTVQWTNPWDQGANPADALANAFATAQTKIATTTALISSNVTTMGTTIGTSLQGILTAVNAIFAVAIPANINLGMATSTASVSTNMATMGATFGTGLQGILTATVAVFGTAIPANVNSGMSSASSIITSRAGSWPGIISGITGRMSSAGYGAGAAAGFGVANGMASALGSIQARASQIASIVANTIALQLQIQSPSKVTTRLGEQVGEGFARGISSKADDVTRASDQLADAASKSLSRVQVPGGGSTGGGSGGDTTSPGTTTTDVAKWSDAIAKGLQVTMSNALKNSGLGTDTTVGSLFNEADFMARRKEMGDALANNIADLFIGRTWVNSTDALINDGKLLEHYGSPVGPDSSITKNPPIIDPTKQTKPGSGVRVIVGTPLPNRPNNGSSRVQQPNVTNHYTTTTTDARTTQQLASPELLRVLDGATKGRTSYSALSNTSINRTLASGSRVNLGRV